MSLGIDLVPKKVCSLDCVYCEVGKTTKLTTERLEYIPYNKIEKEILDYFKKENPEPDCFTFSGSGEPTLNSRIGDIIDLIRNKKPHIPIAILTNGTLLYEKEVRESLLRADIVLPSLDAATTESFRLINRPEKTIRIQKCIQGLIDFRKEYKGKIFMEVFILPGYNNSKKEIIGLKKALKKIKPDKIQLNTLDRPGTIESIRAATKSELFEVIDTLGMDNVEIIASAPQRKNITSYRKDAENTILETIARRPCTLDDLSKILGLHINEINKYLDVLEAENQIEVIRQERGYFYQKKNK